MSGRTTDSSSSVVLCSGETTPQSSPAPPSSTFLASNPRPPATPAPSSTSSSPSPQRCAPLGTSHAPPPFLSRSPARFQLHSGEPRDITEYTYFLRTDIGQQLHRSPVARRQQFHPLDCGFEPTQRGCLFSFLFLSLTSRSHRQSHSSSRPSQPAAGSSLTFRFGP